MADSGDLELVVALARGDRQALAALYDRYAATMLGFGVKILQARGDTEEVLHDVFLEVWRTAGDFDPRRGTVRTWLLLRMRSRCLDRLKSAGRARTTLAGAQLEALAGTTDPKGVEMSDGVRLRGAVARLPESQRRVLELGYFGGLSYSDIASELGVPVGTVKSRVHAAMKQLRDRFEPPSSAIDARE